MEPIHLQANFDKGGFLPELYSTQSKACRSLIDMISLSRSRGAEVVILVVPDGKSMCAHMPAIALTTLVSVLEENFRASAPPVINMQSAIPEELFKDFYHLSKDGKRLHGELRRRVEPVEDSGPETGRGRHS